MASFLRFELPLPPGINNQYATVNGRRVLSAEARRWRGAAEQHIGALDIEAAFVAALREGYLAVFLDFYFATPLKRDLDGGLKIALDSICAALGVDDRRVVDIHLVKRIDPLHPHIAVELEALPDWAFEAERRVL